ncbi:MAG: ABC transporter permease [Bacteroidota bacterium]|nr:ABC transporter permease [Bacteroidota bacterium]
MWQKWIENVAIALGAIRMNAIRASLTILIIAFGIMSLISMLTAVDGIKASLTNNFAGVGSNSFSISNQDELGNLKRGRNKKTKYKNINYKQAKTFQAKFKDKGMTSISFVASGTSIVEYQSTETSPKISVVGSDENFITTGGLVIEQGRNFTEKEISSGRKLAIIGSALKTDLFGMREAEGKIIKVDNQTYTVIGVLKTKGQMFGRSQDNMLIMPLISAQNQYLTGNVNYEINVTIPDVNAMDQSLSEGTGNFRAVRRLKLSENNDFSISTSDSLIQVLLQNVGAIQMIAIVIGIITLLGAAIGLTNIMLVTVTERTREIGIRKALGANYLNIRNQFLLEAIVICQIGGVVGILLGIILGNVVARYFSDSFQMPWPWIILGFCLCFFTGIFAGLYPASKAAKLDPIESLRHE